MILSLKTQPLHSVSALDSLCFCSNCMLVLVIHLLPSNSRLLLFAGKTSAFRFLLCPYFCVTTLWKTTKQPPEQIWEARCSVDHWNYPCHLADVFAWLLWASRTGEYSSSAITLRLFKKIKCTSKVFLLLTFEVKSWLKIICCNSWIQYKINHTAPCASATYYRL